MRTLKSALGKIRYSDTGKFIDSGNSVTLESALRTRATDSQAVYERLVLSEPLTANILSEKSCPFCTSVLPQTEAQRHRDESET